MTDTLVTTLIRESQSKIPGRSTEAELVIRRFIRSVARIYVIVSVEAAPSFKKGYALSISIITSQPTV